MNNEQNMTQNSNQTTQAAAEQTAAEQAAVEQKLAKKKLTRRIFIGGGLGALAVVGGGAGWAYNRGGVGVDPVDGLGPGERLRIRLRHRKP